MLNKNIISICKKRTGDHILRVKHFYSLMVRNHFIPDEYVNFSEVMHHDDDKLKQHNLRRQALRFSKDGNFSDEDRKEINNVIREHVKSNPHHCEYWGEKDEDHLSTRIDCTAMPLKYIYEMIADWAATAEEHGTKIIDWYDKCVLRQHRWIFSREQIQTILECISYLQPRIDPMLKRDYGLTYIDPAANK